MKRTDGEEIRIRDTFHALVEHLLNEENGISAISYVALRNLQEAIDTKNARKIAEDLFERCDATDGRFYIPS